MHQGIHPNGKWMLVANQDSANVVVFAIDGETGARFPLTPIQLHCEAGEYVGEATAAFSRFASLPENFFPVELTERLRFFFVLTLLHLGTHEHPPHNKHRYNEMASLLFPTHDNVFKNLLQEPPDILEPPFSPSTLLFFFLFTYGLMIVTYGCAVPAGLFMPTIVFGSAFGGFVGRTMHNIFPGEKVDVSNYALIGMCACLGGIMRSTVALAVTILEGTDNIQFLLPILIVIWVILLLLKITVVLLFPIIIIVVVIHVGIVLRLSPIGIVILHCLLRRAALQELLQGHPGTTLFDQGLC